MFYFQKIIDNILVVCYDGKDQKRSLKLLEEFSQI